MSSALLVLHRRQGWRAVCGTAFLRSRDRGRWTRSGARSPEVRRGAAASKTSMLLLGFPVVGVLLVATARLVPSLPAEEWVTVYYQGGGSCCQFDMRREASVGVQYVLI